MISWLSDPTRVADVAAWGFIISVLGTLATLAGLAFTYAQARRARLSAERIREEISAFDLKKDKSDALAIIGEAKSAMEGAGLLIKAESWRDAVSNYDDARKSLQKIRLICSDLSSKNQRNLRLICDHLSAFASDVELALVGKGDFPQIPAVRTTIRKNSDILTVIQREIQEALK